MPEQKQFQKRQVACKTIISSILSGNFSKDELSAGFVRINNIVVSRVNVMANLVYKSEENYTNAVIDDGSGKISLKSFDNKGLFANIDVGDFILVIGRVREFNKERYVMPEIIKKVDIAWVNVRKLELRESIETKAETNITEDLMEGAAIDKDVYELIKKLDYGDGVAVEDLVKNYESINVERIVSRLLENGDVFEIKPGKIKVLE